MNAPLRRRRLDELAQDLGRLRRRLDADTYDAFLAQRIAAGIDTLDALNEATAAELVAEGVPAEQALEQVDARAAQLRALLGEPRR